MYIAVFDTLQFLRQLKTGQCLLADEKSLTQEQFEAIRDARLQLYVENAPQYLFDASAVDGIACADGFLRQSTFDERQRGDNQRKCLGFKGDHSLVFDEHYYSQRITEKEIQ